MRTKLALMMASLLGLSVLIVSNQEASAATSTSKQIANLKKQIKELESLVDALSDDVDTLSSQLEVLSSKPSSSSVPVGYGDKTIRFLAFTNYRGDCPSGVRAELFGEPKVIPTRPWNSSGTFTGTANVIECSIQVLGK